MTTYSTDITDQPAEHPVFLTAAEIRATLADPDGKLILRRPFSPATCTVLGYPAKSYWPHLLFDHAIPRAKSSLMVVLIGSDAAPADPHLSVPYQHPEDPIEADVRDLGWYRVRPKWEVGDRLWVKETWATMICYDYLVPSLLSVNCDPFYYRADSENGEDRGKWRRAISMLRWAARLILEITAYAIESEAATGSVGKRWSHVFECRRLAVHSHDLSTERRRS